MFEEQPCVFRAYPEKHLTMEKYIDSHCFLSWKYRGGTLTIKEFKKKIGIIINPHIDDDIFLAYAEFILNMINIFIYDIRYSANINKTNLVNALSDNIKRILDKLGYEYLILSSDKVIIKAKDPVSDVVAKHIPELEETLYQYNHISSKGDIKRKRELLLALADKYEPLAQKLKQNEFSSLERNLGFLLNNINIRHNNREGKYRNEVVATIGDNELEGWYDKTYGIAP